MINTICSTTCFLLMRYLVLSQVLSYQLLLNDAKYLTSSSNHCIEHLKILHEVSSSKTFLFFYVSSNKISLDLISITHTI